MDEIFELFDIFDFDFIEIEGGGCMAIGCVILVVLVILAICAGVSFMFLFGGDDEEEIEMGAVEQSAYVLPVGRG
jgi:flagellar basal body-associated protein FliL